MNTSIQFSPVGWLITHVEITISGEGAGELPTGEANLAHKAAKLVALYAGIEADVKLHLNKRIPVAGGLAGGSADVSITKEAPNYHIE